MKLIKFSGLIILIILNSTCTNAQNNQSLPSQQDYSDNDLITIGNKLKLHSKVLGEEKEIHVSLPHKYDERVHSYPVIFVLEAEFLFEPTSTITKFMAARSKMPQSIIIGLANGDFEKRHEVGLKKWGGKPDKYLEFFKTELIPYVEKNYRANAHRTIIGLSPSTGFLFEAFLFDPNIFKGYIALSTHLEWDRVDGVNLIDEIISKIEDSNYPKATLYLGRADSDLEQPSVKIAFDDASEKLRKSIPKNVTCKIDILENEEHYLMSLGGIREGFATIYPDSIWKNPGWIGWDKNVNYADSYYRKYFGELSNIYGFDIYPVEDGHSYGYHFSGKIYSAKRWGTNKQVIELAELGVEYYPNSASLHMSLAQAYKLEGKLDMALNTGEKAIKLATTYHVDELEWYKKKFEELKN